MGTARASIAPAPILTTARLADAELSPKASMRRVSINSAANEAAKVHLARECTVAQARPRVRTYR